MLVLLLSPVPMVRGFGVLLVVGVVARASLRARRAGAAVLALAGAPRARRPARARAARWRALRGADASLGGLARGAASCCATTRSRAPSRARALVGAVRRPGRVLRVGLALAALGWGLDTQTQVETDITKLVPQNLSSLRRPERARAHDRRGRRDRPDGQLGATSDEAGHDRMDELATRAPCSKRFGYSASQRLRQGAPVPGLLAARPVLQQAPAATPANARPSGKLSDAAAGQTALLDAIPPYFSQDVITPDRRVATLAFGIRLMSLAAAAAADRRDAREPAPAGRRQRAARRAARARGASRARRSPSPWRRVETLLASLAVVALVLLLAFRGDRGRALVPLVPIALASGWSALILFAVRVPLNPMSVTLGALVIAISTEFSVLLSERHRQERLAGHDTIEALRRAYRRTGAAVAASGVTAIAGFGVLALSDIRMLRDFGLVTLIDLTVSLLGVLVALPAALVLAGSAPPRRRDGAAARSRVAAAPAWRRAPPVHERRSEPRRRRGPRAAALRRATSACWRC